MKRTTQIAAMTILAFTGLAIAAGPDDTTASDDKQALRGPRVQQQGEGEQQRRMRDRDAMGEGGQEQARERRAMDGREGATARGQEIREMMGALRALKNAEGDLALSEEQEAKIKAITEEHREAVKAYMDEHKEEMEAIRAEMKPGEDGERPSPEARKAAMEKVQAIMQGSPADGRAKKAIMGVLSEGQQTLVKDTIKKQRERVEERRARAAERMGEGGERPEGARERRERPEGAEGDDAPRARRAPDGEDRPARGDRKRPAPPADG